MFDSMFDQAGEPLLSVVYNALSECARLNSKWVSSEHLLLALLERPEEGESNIASRALASMSIDAKTAAKEIENHLLLNPDLEPLYIDRPESVDAVAKLTRSQGELEKPAFSEVAIEALMRACDYSVFFSRDEVEPEHLLLAIIDSKDSGAVTVLDELSANLTFLRRQIVFLMARDAFVNGSSGSLRSSIVNGLTELVERYQRHIKEIADLGTRSGQTRLNLPSRSEIVHMVVITYLSDFLANQVSFQRYLLEENIRSLSQRIGTLDKELTATIVTSAAQNLRAEVRSTIEHMWCNEYRVLTQMLDEAEHDVIGSVIEDLWWAQSEEIALHESVAEAMDDHRRSHLLNLQKRRLELSQRMTKLRARLDDTVRQCFIKHPISA